MQLFLRYDLSKRYCDNFFSLHYFTTGNQNCLFRFVSKKDMKKCSIRYVVLKCSGDNVSYVTLH